MGSILRTEKCRTKEKRGGAFSICHITFITLKKCFFKQKTSKYFLVLCLIDTGRCLRQKFFCQKDKLNPKKMLINITLLVKRLKLQGIPDDVVELNEVRLRYRCTDCNVLANGMWSNSFVSTSGTIEGSILGPLLYAVYVSPLFDLEKLSTFANDNHIIMSILA